MELFSHFASPTTKIFFYIASPKTLASFIADIDQADTIADDTIADDAVALRESCVLALVAIVGDPEAIEMIEAAGGARCYDDLQTRCDAALLVPLDCCAIVVEAGK